LDRLLTGAYSQARSHYWSTRDSNLLSVGSCGVLLWSSYLETRVGGRCEGRSPAVRWSMLSGNKLIGGKKKNRVQLYWTGCWQVPIHRHDTTTDRKIYFRFYIACDYLK
jgi:hypothetical protein